MVMRMRKRKILNQIKLSIFNNQKIIIENYNELLDIGEEKVVVDIYTISGNFLKVSKMDNYMIEIEGIIRQIIINE